MPLNKGFYTQSLALHTDLYQLTMAYGYWKAGLQNKEAVYHLFFRKRPFGGGFTITAGLESAINFIHNFHFDESDLAFLATLRGANDTLLFEPAFLEFLSTMKLTCDIDAIPEGQVVFPYEPLLRVKGPLIQAQLLESPLLNLINFPTLIATKAARVCIAANGDPVFEFGLRRAQGVDGALTASRASYIGGCEGTSNVLAGKIYGIPLRGTHAHSWIMVFDTELDSFQTYAEVLPSNCIFLVDTYNTIEGVKKAIEVGRWLEQHGHKMLGIRLDSGDLAYLSIASRRLLDEAGFTDAKIVASNELDETIISELKKQGACINYWGVGTNLVTGGSQPALDGVYKLSAVRDSGGPWTYKLKLSEQMIKISNPGILQVKRFSQNETYVADTIYDAASGIPSPGVFVDPLDPTRQRNIDKKWEARDLLVPIFKNGTCIYNLPSLDTIRASAKKELSRLPSGIKRFINPHEYPVGMEQKLYQQKVDLIKHNRSMATHTFTPDES